MDINCGNSESTFNFPVSAVNYVCPLSSTLQNNYKKIPPISEGSTTAVATAVENLKLTPTPTPFLLQETVYNLPINLDLFTTSTPTGTVAPTPTPSNKSKQKYLINFKMNIYTEAILSINLKERYIMLQHSKEGNLPDTPILVTTSHYTNNILDDTSAEFKWMIPWKSSTIDKVITNTTKTSYQSPFVLLVDIAKESPYGLEHWFGEDKTTTQTVSIPNPKAPVQWSDLYFLSTGYQMFLTEFINIYILNKPTTKGSIQIIEPPNMSNNFVATIKITDNVNEAKNTNNLWNFTVAFQN